MKGKIEELLKLPYARVLTPDETGGYVAEVLELPGCVSEGDTAEQAVENLEDAMRGWFEVAIEDGRHIPEPLESGEYNGRILVRVPKWGHRQCVRLAEADGVSLNQWILEAIGERIGAEGFADRLVERTRTRVMVYEETKTVRHISMLSEEPATVEATSEYAKLPAPGAQYAPLREWRVAEQKETYNG